MKILASINLVPPECPVCNRTLDTDLDIFTKHNRYTYNLKNKEYPLHFKRTLEFCSDSPNALFINKDDKIYLNLFTGGAEQIKLSTNCTVNHYSATIFHNFVTSNGPMTFLIQPINIYEQVKVGKYIIHNSSFNENTHIVKNGNQYFFTDYTTILSVKKVPFNRWPIHDEKEFEDKIHSLLLLK